MASYLKCPSCGRLLADKELIFQEKINEINKKNLNDFDKENACKNLMDELQIPTNNYCCKMRLITSCDLFNIVK